MSMSTSLQGQLGARLVSWMTRLTSRRWPREACIAAALTLLTACSANHYTAYRHRAVSKTEPSITAIDAKQRVILTGMGGADAELRFCSEPSPDVFTVVAQALSAGGTFAKGADSAAAQAALNAAFSSSEQGSTIPRTQTVNMLRELMFRTCERYLNGAISKLEMPLQAIRDQRLMVSILAIEQLTGAVTPKPVVIGALGSAAGGASGAEATVRIDDAYKDLQAKTAAQQKRQGEFDELNTDSKDCDAIAQAVAKKEEDKLSDALKAKKAKCETATSALASAKSERANAATHYAKLTDVVASGGIPVSAATTLMDPKADGGIDRAHDGDIASVTEAVREIVQSNFTQDEFLFLCLKVLGPDASQSIIADVKQTCVDYLKSGIDLENARNQVSAKAMLANEIIQSKAQDEVATRSLFEVFWKNVTTKKGAVDAKALAAYKARFPGLLGCFTSTGSSAEFEKCFGHLLSQQKRDLANWSIRNDH